MVLIEHLAFLTLYMNTSDAISFVCEQKKRDGTKIADPKMVFAVCDVSGDGETQRGKKICIDNTKKKNFQKKKKREEKGDSIPCA